MPPDIADVSTMILTLYAIPNAIKSSLTRSDFWEIFLCCQCLASPRLVSKPMNSCHQQIKPQTLDKRSIKLELCYSGLASFTQLMKALNIFIKVCLNQRQSSCIYLNAFSPEVHFQRSRIALPVIWEPTEFPLSPPKSFWKPLTCQTCLPLNMWRL